jgi:chemotaxis protein methyltransferase CheR
MGQAHDYIFIKEYLHINFGLELPEKLRPLTKSKLSFFAKKYEIKDWVNFLDELQKNLNDKIVDDFIDIFVVGHTSFFRNRKQFDFLKKTILPDFVETHSSKKTMDLRIWSAGCSTGEEPYSILISLMEYFGKNYNDITCGVLATDVSQKSLDYAISGQYANIKAGSKIKEYLAPYIYNIGDETFEIKKTLRKEATFRKLNLAKEIYPFKDPFHVIFCRNVFLYFNDQYRHRIQSKIVDNLDQGGYLFLGDAEKFDFPIYGLSRIGNGIYKK